MPLTNRVNFQEFI